MRRIILLAAVAATVGASATALAEEKKPKARPGFVEVDEVHIVGKHVLPMAAAFVTKLPMTQTLTELRQPFVERIEAAIEKDPF